MIVMYILYSKETGRVFAVSYDIAGGTLDCTALDTLKDDWKRLVDEEKVTESDRYIHHNGKPVLSIWGIGFTTVPSSACPEKMQNLINWFHGLPDSGGNTAPQKYQAFVMGGVPSKWKDRTGDSRTAAVWKDVYESLDAIHPWYVGRWSSINNFYNYYNNIISRDANYCAQMGILYIPTMWAGFSWHNLQQREKPINDIPRLGGNFLWAQAHRYASNSNINSVSREFSLFLLVHIDDINFTHRFPYRFGWHNLMKWTKVQQSSRSKQSQVIFLLRVLFWHWMRMGMTSHLIGTFVWLGKHNEC